MGSGGKWVERLWWAAVFAAVVACSKPRAVVRFPERHARLGNGARIILLPDASSNMVSVVVRYPVGAADDPGGRAGLAHLVEHLVYQKRVDGGQTIMAASRQHAVSYNGFTAPDHTQYETLAHESRLEEILALEGARARRGCEGLDEPSLAVARETVRNELRWRRGSAQGGQIRWLAAIFPPGHPYTRMEEEWRALDAITLAEVCAFISTHYVPERMVVVIAGNVTEARAAAAAAAHLAPLPPGGGPPPAARIAGIEPGRATVRMAVPIPLVTVAFPLPAAGTVDEIAAEAVIARMSARAPSTWFTTILGAGEQRVFLVVAPPEGDPESPSDHIFRLASDTLYEVDGVAPSDVLRFERRVALIRELEPILGRARFFAEAAQHAPERGYFGGKWERLRWMTFETLADGMRRFIDRERARVALIVPTGDAPIDVTEVFGKSLQADDARVEDAPVDPAEAAVALPLPPPAGAEPRVEERKLKNGARVVLIKTGSTIPVVTVRLLFTAGAAHEDRDAPGVAAYLAALLEGPLYAQQHGSGAMINFPSQLAMAGADAQVAVTDDTTIFQASALSTDVDVLIEGLVDRADKGTLGGGSEEEDAIRDLVIERYRRGPQVDRVARAAAVGDGHPYAEASRPTHGERPPREQLLRFRTSRYVGRNAVLIIAGNFDRDDALDAAKVLERFPAGQDTRRAVARPIVRTGPRHIVIPRAGTGTLAVRLVYPAGAGRDRHHAARLVLSEILDQRAWRIRQRTGATYSAQVAFQPRLGPGLYVLDADVDPARGEATLAALREAFARPGLDRAGLEDFVRARRRVLAQLLVRSSESGALVQSASDLVAHGHPAGAGHELAAAVARLTPEDVDTVAAAELRADRLVVVVEGVEAPARKALGRLDASEVTVVPAEN